jgi:hypothetical protein
MKPFNFFELEAGVCIVYPKCHYIGLIISIDKTNKYENNKNVQIKWTHDERIHTIYFIDLLDNNGNYTGGWEDVIMSENEKEHLSMKIKYG